MSSEISRRSFLGVGAAAVAAVAGAASLSNTAKAAPGAMPESDASGNATTAESTTGNTHLAVNDTGNPGYWDENGMWIPGWLVAPAAPEAADEELDCDVLVVGLGVAGLCAARAAIEEGVSVICVEQSENYNCRAAQFGNINSSWAEKGGVVFTPEEKIGMLNAEMQANGWRPDARIWNYWINHSGEAFDWHVSANPDIIFLDPNQTPTESGVNGADVPTGGMGAESVDGNMYMTCFNNPNFFYD